MESGTPKFLVEIYPLLAELNLVEWLTLVCTHIMTYKQAENLSFCAMAYFVKALIKLVKTNKGDADDVVYFRDMFNCAASTVFII